MASCDGENMSLACTKFLKENDRSVWGRIADRMCMRVN